MDKCWYVELNKKTLEPVTKHRIFDYEIGYVSFLDLYQSLDISLTLSLSLLVPEPVLVTHRVPLKKVKGHRNASPTYKEACQ
jgi:hypothetical protein